VNFRHVEVFYAVMTNGTVTEAARQLGVSQPSVTTTLKQAEARLGIQLFHRESGRLVPTREARILFEEAERAHNALEAIRMLAQRLEIGQGGHVRVASVPTISLELLPDAIRKFETLHTGFHYSVATLNSEDILTGLDRRTGTYDLGFTFGTQDANDVASEEIGHTGLHAVVPAAWDLPRDSVLELGALRGRPFVAGFDHTALAQECRRLFADAGFEPDIVARSHMHHLAGCLAQRGIGYAILDALTVRALLNNERADAIVVKRLAGDPTIPLAVMYPGRQNVSNAAGVFLDCFREAFAALTI